MGDDDDADGLIEFPRPGSPELLKEWKALMNDPLLTMSSLKKRGVEGKIERLRSVYWRHFYDLLPSPAAPTSSTHSTYKLALERTRAEYTKLKDQFLDTPALDKDVPASINNPLSTESPDKGNRFAAYFDDLELKRIIKQDCQRTFPDIAYFRSDAVQDTMTELLFLYAKSTPDIGYRQGLHELLAPVLWMVDYDSLSTDQGDWLAGLVLSRQHVPHDAYALFAAMMRGAKVLYDFVPSVPQPVERNPAASAVLPTSPATTLVQPIVAIANRVHDKLLRTIDMDLWQKMESLQVEPQIFAIRWLRLLFSREFPILDVLKIWDALFAEDPSLRLIEHVCIAMLLRIRERLLVAEYSTFIQLLLRYPAPPDDDYRIPLLMQQAIMLRDSPSHTTAEICMAQNVAQGASGELYSSSQPASPDTERWRPSQLSARRRQQLHVNTGAGSALLAEGGGIVGDIAKNVYGRAEALGINKALFGTLQELRRNLQQPAPREMTSPSKTTSADARLLSAELSRLKNTSAAMGKAVDACAIILERASLKSQEDPDPIVFAALTALRHVRDVLAGQSSTFHPSVMSPVEMAAKAQTHTKKRGVVDTRHPPAAPGELKRTPSNVSLKSVYQTTPPSNEPLDRSKDPLGVL